MGNFSQFSHSVVSDSLWPHGLQHTRLLCPSPTPGAYSNSCPSSQWCHPTISSSVIPFSSCLQSFPVSGPFQWVIFFTSGGQSIGASATASVLPMNIQDWFLLNWLVGSPCRWGTCPAFNEGLNYPPKKGLSLWQFLHTDIVLDPKALELTMWLSFQLFKRHYKNPRRWPLTQLTQLF